MEYSILFYLYTLLFDFSFLFKMVRITTLSALEKVKHEVTLQKKWKGCIFLESGILGNLNEVRTFIKYIFFPGRIFDDQWMEVPG